MFSPLCSRIYIRLLWFGQNLDQKEKNKKKWIPNYGSCWKQKWTKRQYSLLMWKLKILGAKRVDIWVVEPLPYWITNRTFKMLKEKEGFTGTWRFKLAYDDSCFSSIELFLYLLLEPADKLQLLSGNETIVNENFIMLATVSTGKWTEE